VASNDYIYKMSNAGGMSTVTRYTDMLAGNPVFVGSSYDSIATANGTGSSGTITFSSIPSTYSHLQIRMISKGNQPYGFPAGIETIFNSDTTSSNYYNHNIRGDGSSVATSGGSGNISYPWASTGSTGTNIYAVGILDILDYKNTNKFKTSRSILGTDYNGSGMVILGSMIWKNTAAINSITLISDSTYTGNWTTATQFALYGIRG
jgi:hypothetical protein